MIKSKTLTALLASQLKEKKTFMHKKFLRTSAFILTIIITAGPVSLAAMEEERNQIWNAVLSSWDNVYGKDNYNGWDEHEQYLNQYLYSKDPKPLVKYLNENSIWVGQDKRVQMWLRKHDPLTQQVETTKNLLQNLKKGKVKRLQVHFQTEEKEETENVYAITKHNNIHRSNQGEGGGNMSVFWGLFATGGNGGGGSSFTDKSINEDKNGVKTMKYKPTNIRSIDIEFFENK